MLFFQPRKRVKLVNNENVDPTVYDYSEFWTVLTANWMSKAIKDC